MKKAVSKNQARKIYILRRKETTHLSIVQVLYAWINEEKKARRREKKHWRSL